MEHVSTHFEASPVRNAKQRLAKRELRTVVVFSSVTVVVGCGRTSSFLIEFLLACERCSDKLDLSSGMAPRTWHLSTACERTSHDAREQLRRHAVSTMRQSSTRRMTHTRFSRMRLTQRSCLAWLQVHVLAGAPRGVGFPRVWSSLQTGECLLAAPRYRDWRSGFWRRRHPQHHALVGAWLVTYFSAV